MKCAAVESDDATVLKLEDSEVSRPVPVAQQLVGQRKCWNEGLLESSMELGL